MGAIINGARMPIVSQDIGGVGSSQGFTHPVDYTIGWTLERLTEYFHSMQSGAVSSQDDEDE